MAYVETTKKTRQQKEADKQAKEGFEKVYSDWFQVFKNRKKLTDIIIDLLYQKHFNQGDLETCVWIEENRNRLYLRFVSGFVNKKLSDSDAKLTKGDIAIRLEISNVRDVEGLDTVASDPIEGQWIYLSLKQVKSVISKSYYKDTLGLVNFNEKEHFMVDHNEFKSLENQKNKLIIIDDKKYNTGYHIYELHNLYEAQRSKPFYKAEGGSQKPWFKKEKSAHPEMELVEGDVKRKVLIHKAPEHLRFNDLDSLNELYISHFISEHINLKDMLESLERLNHTYAYDGQEQTEISIAPPSPFQCVGATRKEAISCKLTVRN